MEKLSKRAKKNLLKNPYIASVGLCREGVEVEVLPGYSPDDIPAEIGGYPVKLKEVEDYDQLDFNWKGRHRPLRPGIQAMLGSIGFFVSHNGFLYLITAAHVWQGYSTDQLWRQPRIQTLEDTDVGYLYEWVDLWAGVGDDEPIPADAMAVKLLPGVTCTNKIPETGFIPRQVLEPEVGMMTYRTGRETGLTEGEVTAVDVTARVRTEDGVVQVDNSFRVEPRKSISGDSGGGVFCQDPPGILGVHFSAGGHASSAPELLEVLGLSDAKPVQTAVELKIGEKEYTVNGQELQADVAPQIINGRTMVPLRFVAEAFGAEIDWGPEEGQTEWANIHL